MPSHHNLTQLLRGGDTQALINTKNKNEILSLNSKTEKYGLVLTEYQARELVITRNNALRANSRVEFGLGAVKLIIETFADSRYLDRNNYAEVINEITDIFYYIKSETDDSISDVDLVEKLKYYFENKCEGSLELLMSRDLDELLYDGIRTSGDEKSPPPEHIYRPLSEFFDLDETFNDDDFDPNKISVDDKLTSADEKDLDYYDYEELSESAHSGKGLEDGGYHYYDEDDDDYDSEDYSISKFDLENDDLISILDQEDLYDDLTESFDDE